MKVGLPEREYLSEHLRLLMENSAKQAYNDLSEIPLGRAFAVYKLLDSAGHLLYVGVTVDPRGRLLAHRRTKPWWADVARIDIVHFGTRESAYDAEQAMIKLEQPVHNRTGHGGWWEVPA